MPMARVDRLELLDSEAERVPARELAGNLRDIRRANRVFGGTRAVVRGLQPQLRQWPSGAALTLLDLATGSADIPAALLRAAQRAGVDLRVVATDLQPSVLAVARAAEQPGALTLERADARALPYADAAFDIVTLSLALHHFTPEEGRQVLAEMGRVGRRLLLVNDLERSRAGYLGAWLVGHLLTRNRLTRHDAPLSVRRAYTRAEALALARAAGWTQTRVRGAAPFRYVLTGAP
jgi:2-polyprenyl-3-methyl-5-hydroxy-6-metoxy-1,4-benzoquinol methylase